MSEDEPFRYYDDDGNLHPDYVSCPTCNGQGYRDEYSGDPEHGGETCYHCYGHGYVHRTEEENRPIDDIMRDMANDPTKENAQAVRDYFTPKPEMEYDDDFQQKLTGSPMDLAFRLLKAVMPGTAGFPEDEHNTDNIIAIQEQAYRLAELNTPWDKEKWPNYEDWQEAIEMDGEGILAQMMNEPEYAHLRELYSQHSQPPENYGELQLPFKERDDIHNFYRNQGIPLPGIGELPPVPSKVTMHEVDDHPQWPTGTLYDDKSGFTTGEPMDLSWRLLKFRLPMKTNHRSVLPKPNMSRQTTLPEFAPNMSSPHGDVKWFHGTSGDRVGNIQTEGLKPNQGKVWVTGNRDVAENYAGGRSANRYIEEVMQPGGDLASPTQNPVTFGIREGAGSPKRHMGMESFDNTIKPEQLVRMPPTQKPANPAWHTGKSETGPSTGAQGQ